MIELRGYGWRHAGRKTWAVRGIDLRIERGERVLLLGPSGAGKSTLLQAIAGLLPADSGESEGACDLDGRAGIVFQDPQSQLVMSRAGDEVAFGLENLGWDVSRLWARVDEVLAEVGFGHGRMRDTSHLSGGEQQRLVLAGALAPRPDVLLLDEPTANLDPSGAAMVRDVLRGVETMVLIEHRIAEVLPLITRIVVLSADGDVSADGDPSLLDGPLGDELAADGVWIPGRPLARPPTTSAPGPMLVSTFGLRIRDKTYSDLSCYEGEVVAITGPNGSGKSTLALALGGLLRSEQGFVGTPQGRPINWKPAVLARRIGSVFQNPEHQFVTSSVRAELALGGVPRARVDELLARLRLDHLAEANPFTLSGGQARRLSVATALATAPPLLVLDEPTFGQDRRTWTELVSLLATLRDSGHGIIVATHDPDVVAVLADRRIWL